MLEARSGVLNHPNIVTVYDFGEQDGNPYIVMEYVQGDSLENLLRAGTPVHSDRKAGDGSPGVPRAWVMRTKRELSTGTSSRQT
jgi:serine/threonine protein kinase